MDAKGRVGQDGSQGTVPKNSPSQMVEGSFFPGQSKLVRTKNKDAPQAYPKREFKGNGTPQARPKFFGAAGVGILLLGEGVIGVFDCKG